jgi:hypothetical protein
MASRIWIDVVLCDSYSPEGTFEEIREALREYENTNPEHKDFKIDKMFGGYDSPDEYQVVAKRLETDKEFDRRIMKMGKTKAREGREKQDRIAKERELYARLHKKYGDGVVLKEE